MHDSHNPLIQLNFKDIQLESMLADESKTSESFQTDVLAHLHAFIGAQHGKICSCIISITPFIHTTMMMEGVRYDEKLQDACTEEELELANQTGWTNVNIVLIPNAGQDAMEGFHQAVAAEH